MTSPQDPKAEASGDPPHEERSSPRPLTGYAQSKLSWARVAECYDEVPAAYRPWLDPLVRGRDQFPYIVLTPTYEGYFRRENERLVCMVDGTLHIVERARDRLIPVSYHLEEINVLEFGSILLASWITVRGPDTSSVPATSKFRFNTVTDRLFTPFVNAFRLGSRRPSETTLDAERAKFEDLLERNYKFMNFSRSSILPGEEVLDYVYQPEIRQPLVRMFGRSLSRSIAPTHILILTDRELIVISEEAGSLLQSLGTVKYGGIWHYVPVDKIASASLAAREDGRINLMLPLPGEDRLDLLFAPDNRAALESLLALLESRPRRSQAA